MVFKYGVLVERKTYIKFNIIIAFYYKACFLIRQMCLLIHLVFRVEVVRPETLFLYG